MFGTNLNEWQMMKTKMIPTNTPATATSLKQKRNKMKKEFCLEQSLSKAW